jgi:hypothetical protein
VVSEADQAIALRVSAGEERAARRGTQWCGRMCVGEEYALGGELVEPGTGDVIVPVCAEIAAEVVPMHDEEVVSPRLGHAVSFPVTTVHATGCRVGPATF